MIITLTEETKIRFKHHEALCSVFGLKRCISDYGIIAEKGIWPYVGVITCKIICRQNKPAFSIDFIEPQNGYAHSQVTFCKIYMALLSVLSH